LGIFLIALINFGLAIGEILFGAYLLEKRFDFSPEVAEQADRIVKNAGIYNSFFITVLLSQDWFGRPLLVNKGKNSATFSRLCNYCGNFWRIYPKTNHAHFTNDSCPDSAGLSLVERVI
jgi:hypothetical protein